MTSMYIAGTGYYLPPDRITNEDLSRMVATNDEWIVSHTGMKERRRAADDQNTSDLGVLATTRALESAGWRAGDLDLLVVATSTPDRLIPSTASIIAKKMEIDPVAFDVNAACAGFVFGLSVAQSLAIVNGYRRVALCVPEKYTRVTDYTNRATCVFFGDSAGAVLLQPERPMVGLEIADTVLASINEGADFVYTPIGGHFWQDGRRVKEYALRGFYDSATDLLDRNGLDISDITAFAGHQANLRILEEVATKVGLNSDQHWYNVDLCGNQGAAGVVTTLCQNLEERGNQLQDGDLILLTVMGAGFTVGSALLRRVDQRAAQ